jgi:3-oxoacyl-[acyl-carrier protein] reductase
MGAPSHAAYAAAKSGLLGLVRCVASEYAGRNITANALAPSMIDTDMIAELHEHVANVPVGRLGTPAEVAALVTYLCSSVAGYVTGEVIDINGGMLID